MNALATVLICVTVMYLFGEVLRHLRIPRVVSHITAGIILGLPQVRPIVFSAESGWLVQFFADVGVILLLFFVGLQIDLYKFRDALPTSLWISVCNTLFPLVTGFLVTHYVFGLARYAALIVGICLSVSATALAFDLLAELGKLRTRLATFIVSAGTFDDIVEMFLVAGVFTVLETTVKRIGVFELAVNVFIFAAVIFAFRFWLIPVILKRIEGQPEHAQLFTGALIITLLMAILAEYLGISAMIGALFSGVMMRQVLLNPGHKPWERMEITHSIHTLAFGLFVPFFFLMIGLQTDVLAIGENLLFGAAITAIAILGTVLGSAVGYYVTHKNWTEGLVIGWAMNAKGDTELVIAQLALSVGAISQEVFSSLIFMAVVSTLISPLVLKRLVVKYV